MKVIERVLSMDTDKQIHLKEDECCFIAPYEVDEFNKSKEYDKTFHLYVRANSKDRWVTVNIFKSIDHDSIILAIIGAVLNDNNKQSGELVVNIFWEEVIKNQGNQENTKQQGNI